MLLLKKVFPQCVINGLFTILFIFVIALIGVLHTKNANAETIEIAGETIVILDWTAPGFLPKLMKQCPGLSPAVVEIATKLANMAEETRERVRNVIESKLKRGATKEQAENSGRLHNFMLPLTHYRGMPYAPLPPLDYSTEQRKAWHDEFDRVQAEKEERFLVALFTQCPQIPDAVARYAVEEHLAPGRYIRKKQ